MTAQDRWKQNVEGQKALDVFVKEFGDECFAAMREKSEPQPSKAQGMDADREDARSLTRWQGFKECLNVLPDMGYAALNPMDTRMPPPNRLMPLQNQTAP